MFVARDDSSNFEVSLRDPFHVKNLDKPVGLRLYQKSLNVGHARVKSQIGEQLVEACEGQLSWWNLQVDQLFINQLNHHPLSRQKILLLQSTRPLQSRGG